MKLGDRVLYRWTLGGAYQGRPRKESEAIGVIVALKGKKVAHVEFERLGAKVRVPVLLEKLRPAP